MAPLRQGFHISCLCYDPVQQFPYFVFLAAGSSIRCEEMHFKDRGVINHRCSFCADSFGNLTDKALDEKTVFYLTWSHAARYAPLFRFA